MRLQAPPVEVLDLLVSASTFDQAVDSYREERATNQPMYHYVDNFVRYRSRTSCEAIQVFATDETFHRASGQSLRHLPEHKSPFIRCTVAFRYCEDVECVMSFWPLLRQSAFYRIAEKFGANTSHPRMPDANTSDSILGESHTVCRSPADAVRDELASVSCRGRDTPWLYLATDCIIFVKNAASSFGLGR